ncbi:MAG: TonB family protein [Alphaproteobacteria bacterium]|nr:TonB family protein [Alphaproteobacteria bacterium]
MRVLPMIVLAWASLVLAACGSVPELPSLPQLGSSDERPPFMPRDEFPHAPNIARMMDEEDCRGATLAAMSARMPDYPGRAYGQGRQGWVVVRFDVLQTGSVDNVRIARSVPDGIFDREARRAVRDWRFRALETSEPLRNCVVMFEFRAGEVSVR